MRWIATAIVEEAAQHAPYNCFLSLDRRAYDVTSFVEHHPGGDQNMRDFHGRDASQIFDVFAHSPSAHAMMRRQFLRFDSVAFVGRPGEPSFAIGSDDAANASRLHTKWSLAPEVLAFVREAAGFAPFTTTAHPPWWSHTQYAEATASEPTLLLPDVRRPSVELARVLALCSSALLLASWASRVCGGDAMVSDLATWCEWRLGRAA